MVPSMLYYGIDPRVASATSSFNYFFIAINNLITLILGDLLPFGTAAWFAFLAMIGGSFIVKLGYYLINKYKKAFIVIFIVFGLAISNIVAGIWYITIQS